MNRIFRMYPSMLLIVVSIVVILVVQELPIPRICYACTLAAWAVALLGIATGLYGVVRAFADPMPGIRQ